MFCFLKWRETDEQKRTEISTEVTLSNFNKSTKELQGMNLVPS